MLILLPPSEGKRSPLSGAPLDLDGLTSPVLTAARRRVLAALVSLCRADETKARQALGLGPTQSLDIRRNAALRQNPCASAIDVYTGVLYAALDAATLPATARRRLDSSTLIASALFGMVSPRDRIPAYRMNTEAELPAIGSLVDLWRAPTQSVLLDRRGPILDLRSTAYAAIGPIPAQAAARTLVGRVLQERNGRRSVVSHHNKATKGRLVRGLVSAGALPRSVNGVIDAITSIGYIVEVHEPTRPDRAAVIDIVVRET